MTGRVKWFDDKRGYGFITSDEGRDVYVHYTAIATDGYRTLKHNWRVEYEVVTVEDGREEARNVVVLPKLVKETPEHVQLKPRKRGKSSRR
jgi:CspA family cold shock protein